MKRVGQFLAGIIELLNIMSIFELVVATVLDGYSWIKGRRKNYGKQKRLRMM
ncbi:hypothetical protein FD13_GL001287 [Levilactobacillus senmaizukei DSM 21775 = NBRC 103853]|uniref:Uncharacterized protein n=1 Tax=Levilactobacillus senmaizukei DSM 21775 = NBRC 103853 TaxID=1423803 RepID=A0A0R2DIQ6_9LACO|nr:hypothetical protein [Levilactobacillus senmaizukei]KRN02971.1 hypothetical protein FD13_GL001287 [Levilactobacillus senmaizukei DSM 21775 = NBRC 103853]